MIIPINTTLYQSMSSNITSSMKSKDFTFRYPVYFTNHYTKANIYIGLNPTNKCGVFRNNKKLDLLNLSFNNKTHQTVLNIVNFKKSTKEPTNLLVKNIFGLCFEIYSSQA